MGDADLDVVLLHRKDKFSVEVAEVPFKVPYLSTLAEKAEGLGRHVKQSGGHGQYGICNLRVEPLPRGEGFVFDRQDLRWVDPALVHPVCRKGRERRDGAGRGTGFRMIDVKVELYDGKYHSVDSTDFAFQLAGITRHEGCGQEGRPRGARTDLAASRS